MSHLICCERQAGGRVFFFPEAVSAFLVDDKRGPLSVFMRNDNIVQLKNETPETLVAKMIEAGGGKNIVVVRQASKEILDVLDLGTQKEDHGASVS